MHKILATIDYARQVHGTIIVGNVDAPQQFWLQLIITVLIGGIGIYYQRKQIQLAKPDRGESKWFKYWPIVLMILLAASSWIPYFLRHDDLPDFPDPHPFVQSWGDRPSEKECFVLVNGDRFLKYAHYYRLAGGCYFYDGIGDILDAPQLQVSRSYDINNSQILMRIQWGPGFKQYLEAKKSSGLNMVVFMLPFGVEPGQFSTLRQARALGVRIIPAGGTR